MDQPKKWKKDGEMGAGYHENPQTKNGLDKPTT